jgi:hypothetical protein
VQTSREGVGDVGGEKLERGILRRVKQRGEKRRWAGEGFDYKHTVLSTTRFLSFYT